MKGCGDGRRGGDWNNHQKQHLGAGEMAWWLKHSAFKCKDWSLDSQKTLRILGLCRGSPVIPASEDQDRGFPEIMVAIKTSWSDWVWWRTLPQRIRWKSDGG